MYIEIKNLLKNYFYVESIFNMIILKLSGVNIHGFIKVKGKIYIKNNGEFEVGKGCIFNSRYSANPIGGQQFCTFIIAKGAKLNIGEGVGISNSTIVCHKEVTIGDFAMIGGDCKIYDTDFHSVSPVHRLKKGGDPDIKNGSIRIGSKTFIGGGSIILKGVSIGNNSVIGAGSVVTKDIPDDEIWAGNPAKFIRNIPEPTSG